MEISARNVIHAVVQAVPESERRLKGREKVKTLSRLAREALTLAARYNGFTLGRLVKDERGAPLPSNGIYWSLTHKGTCVAATAARVPVGIDLEIVRPFRKGLFKRLAQPREWELAAVVDDRLFVRFWTAKEAVLKATGQGLAGLSDCRIVSIIDNTQLQVACRNSMWTVVQCWIDPVHLVAVTAGNTAVEWHLPDPITL